MGNREFDYGQHKWVWREGVSAATYHGEIEAAQCQTGVQTGQATGGPVSAVPTKRYVPFNWTLPSDSAARKRHPIVTGFLDYFPDAVSAIAFLSWAGNEKHNPGQPLHWARGKSADQEDCIGRHLVERGGVDFIETADAIYEIPHTVALAWRAMAQLQLACEANGAPKARGAK